MLHDTFARLFLHSALFYIFQVSGDTSASLSLVDSIKIKCLSVLIRDKDLWMKKNSDDMIIPAAVIMEALCPQSCRETDSCLAGTTSHI